MSGWGGGNSSSQSTTDSIYNGVQLTQSTYGIPVPLVYGMTRVPGFLLQYEDFTVTPHTDSSGGGKGGQESAGNSTHTYSAAVVIGICESTGVHGGCSIASIFADKNQTGLNDTDLNFTFFDGANGQAPWSYLTSKHPTRALGYDLTCYVGGGPTQLGSSAALPNVSFEMKGIGSAFGVGSGIFDVFADFVLTDYLTDPFHGAEFPYLGDTSALANYVSALALYMSPQETTQRTANDMITELLQCNNCDALWSQGLLTFVPYGDETVVGTLATYTPNLTPLFSFTDDDYVQTSDTEDPVQVEHKAPEELYNSLRVEFLDRANQYNTAVAEATIDLDIIENGRRPMQDLSFHEITTATVARQVAQLILNRQFYIRNTYTFALPAIYAQLEAGDVVELNDSTIGLSQKLVRLTEVKHGAAPKRLVSCIAEELLVGPGGSPVYNWELSQGFAANYGTAPGAVNTPLIFNAPPALVGVNGGYEIWIAVSGSSNWGGANVYASLDNLSYEYVGTINGPAKYGTLTAALPAETSDPDTVNTLKVLLADTTVAVPSSTTNDADALRSLLWVDGEIMSYGTASQSGTGTYNISYLRRALYQSANASHANGSSWARLDTGIFRLPIDPGFTGQTLFLKFASFNPFQKKPQDLSLCTAYSHVLAANSMGSTLPSTGANFVTNGVTVVGSNLYKTGTTSAYDADAYAIQPLTNGCAVSWRGGKGTYSLGLSQNPSATLDNTSIDFAFRMTIGGNLFIDKLGVQVGSSFGATDTNDQFEIRYDNVAVQFFQNGNLLTAIRAPGLTLFAKASFHDPGSIAADVVFVPATSTGIVGGNFMPSYPWVVGTSGDQNNFAQIVTNAGGSNSIILGDGSSLTSPLGPFQTTEPLWKSTGGTTGVGLIGWRDAGDLFGLDPTKSYRFSVWMRWTGSGTTGSFQFGIDAGFVKNLSPGTLDSDPAFVFGRFPLIASDQWFLVIGIIHGSGYTGGQSGISGIYDPTVGDRVQTADGFTNGGTIAVGSDFKFVAGSNDISVNVLNSDASSTSTIMFTCRPRFDEINGNEPSIATLMAPAAVDPSIGPAGHVARHGIVARGNVVPVVQGAGFTYTSTTTSLQWSWTGYQVFRADGTSFNMTSGNQNITGLSASTTYISYAYSVETSPSAMGFATSSVAVGTPQMAFPPSATYAQLAAAQAGVSVLGNLFQGKLTGATPASGSGGGGGGGGGFGCPHPDQYIWTSDGRKLAKNLKVGDELLTLKGWAPIVKLTYPLHSHWREVEFDNGERVLVTPDHRFVAPNGQQIRAANLRIEQIIRSGGERHLEVTMIRRRDERANAVAIELEDPHLYYLTLNGPLSHNLKP